MYDGQDGPSATGNEDMSKMEDAADLEANPEEIESESENREILGEATAVETDEAQESRSENQRPAVLCRNPRKSKSGVIS
jgi:hypothetical protein